MERSICPQCGFFLQPNGSCKRCEALSNPKLEKNIEALKESQPTDMVTTSEETALIAHKAKKMTSIDCPSCGLVDAVQKVTAIVEGETHHTTGHTRTSTYSSISGKQDFYAQENAWKKTKIGQGKISGDTYGTSFERINAVQQSDLAQKLMPPDKPTPPAKPDFTSFGSIIGSSGLAIVIGFITWVVVGIASLLAMSSYLSQLDIVPIQIIGTLVMWITAPIIGFVAGIIVAILVGKRVGSLMNKTAYPESTRRKMQIDYEMASKEHLEYHLPRWESAMQRWNSMFYCRRCDVIYVPGDEVYYNGADNVINLAYHNV